MDNIKETIYYKLIKTGRFLVEQKGVDFLTARKLSEASGCSVGAIYNQFGSMDNFVAKQNQITIKQLLDKLSSFSKTNDIYYNINSQVDIFVNFVCNNPQIWFLLYSFHLNNKDFEFCFAYKKDVAKIIKIIFGDMSKLFARTNPKELKLFSRVLLISIITQSSVLTTTALDKINTINKDNLIKILLNTFMTGMLVLDKD